MKCPTVSRTIVISDSPRLAAGVSCSLAQPGMYLPVVDGPRLARPDRAAEIVRRNNAAARARAIRFIYAGLSPDTEDAFRGRFPIDRIVRVATSEEAANLRPADQPRKPPLDWGRDLIGLGTLIAMRQGTDIAFNDRPSVRQPISSKSGHVVVCEEGEDLSEIIAANYAYALRASLITIPAVPKALADELLERLYSLYEQRDDDTQTARLGRLKSRLRELCGDIAIPDLGSVSFFTRELPFGFAFPEAPSTHLFTYPDLGISVVNGLCAEQPNTRGVNVVALVDPEKADAPEIEISARLLAERGMFIRGYSGASATVQTVTEVTEHFPYDLLMFATHCGDAPGSRETFEYSDSEGRNRQLVVDVALSIARTRDPDRFEVSQYLHFHSLDGVDWSDPEKENKVYIGTAIADFMDKFRTDRLKPVRRQAVTRVPGSAALAMHDGNYIALPQTIAGLKAPIVINNACASWHQLAARFFWAGARAYIGTLFPVLTSESVEVTRRVLDRHYGKPLAHALWSAQNEAFEESARRPYVMTGVYPQQLRVSVDNVPLYLERHFAEAIPQLRGQAERLANEGNNFGAEKVRESIAYHQVELQWFRHRRPR